MRRRLGFARAHRLSAGPSPFFLGSLGCLFAALVAGCGDDAALCDAASLARSLEAAGPGTTVRVGSCRVEGVSVEVPAGVTLQGTGESSLVGTGTSPVVSLGAGATLRDIRIETPGSVGVRTDAPDVSLTNVGVTVQRGIGVGVEGPGARLTGVTIVGSDDASSFPPFAEPDEGAYGVVLLDAGEAAFVDVRLQGVGPWGGIVAGTTLTWTGGAMRDVVGTGLYVEGGSVDLQEVVFDGFTQGLQPLPAYGVVFTNGALATTTGIEVANGDIGVLHDRASGTHTDASVHDNRYGGLWIQRSDDVMIAGGAFVSNGVTGIASVLSSNVTADGSMVASSVSRITVFGETGAVEAGDGIQVVQPTGPNTLRALTLRNHPRIGVLIDLGATAAIDEVALTAVSVEGEGLGCLAQEVTGLVPLGGWDDGVTRLGATAANDAARARPLALGGRLTDGNLPAVDLGMIGL